MTRTKETEKKHRYSETELIRSLEQSSFSFIVPYVVALLCALAVLFATLSVFNNMWTALIFGTTVFFMVLFAFDVVFVNRVNRKCPQFLSKDADHHIVKAYMKSVNQHTILMFVCLIAVIVYVVALELPYL